ncbi:alpha-amylase family glycosyl hydrolase, partial [Enterococcus cecorum]
MKEWWQSEIIYQIYPRSFQDSNQDGIGDIQGIIQRLDYLHDLGITTIWISPIFESPMADNGYDISNYFGIASEFGTMEDFKELVLEAKKRQIKILLDLVVNHTSDEHPWFQQALANPQSKYRDYYIFKAGKKRPNNWRSIFGGSVWEKLPNEDMFYYHTFHKKQPDLNWENPQLRSEIHQMIIQWL